MRAFFIIFCLTFSSVSLGGTLTGAGELNSMLTRCGTADAADNFLCGLSNGYIAGVVDTAAVYEHNGAEVYFCLPANLVAGQVTEIVKKYLKEHPEKYQMAASSVVISALVKAFPCK